MRDSLWFGATLVATLVACGGGRSDDARVCTKMTTLCGAAHRMECLTADDWRDMRRDLGGAAVDRFRGCVLRADQCTALAACVLELGADAVRALDDDQLRKLGLPDAPAPDAAPPPPTVAPDAAPASAADDGGPASAADGGSAPIAAPDAGSTAAPADAAVRFDRVTVRTAPTAFGHGVSVAIELTVIGAMPTMAPTVTVQAACDGATDGTDHAFFQSLDGAAVGQQRADTVALFTGSALAAPPAQCEVVLGTTGGATALAHYCFRAGATTPGTCPATP
ncbi:MAG: hypothetical protein JNK64_12295 [Myxococcales bacterium]|nr:hypothetical protein [Myxococcales bacterium]